MFDDRQDEQLVWLQLDLDTIAHDVKTHRLIIPICHQIEAWGINKLLEKHVDVHQKVYDFTPNQKTKGISQTNGEKRGDKKRGPILPARTGKFNSCSRSNMALAR